MSTNALLKFYDTPNESKDRGGSSFVIKELAKEFYIYKHWDGYPAGIAIALAMTLDHAFKLPRFQANDFSAAFIAANKNSDNPASQGGNVYISDGSDYRDYEYHITFKDGDLWIKVLENDGVDESEFTPIFESTYKEFIKFAEDKENQE